MFYAILLFIAWDFTFTTRPIHNWTSFPFWLSHFILCGAISNCPPLFPSSILNSFWLAGLIFPRHTFSHFNTVHTGPDISLSCIGEGNGNPLQCSCLENPRDGGAWWAAVYGVAQSPTRLKRLSSSSSSSIRALNGMACRFIELCKPLRHDKAVIHEGEMKIIVHIWGGSED